MNDFVFVTDDWGRNVAINLSNVTLIYFDYQSGEKEKTTLVRFVGGGDHEIHGTHQATFRELINSRAESTRQPGTEIDYEQRPS